MLNELFRLLQNVPLIFFRKLGRVDDAMLSLPGVSGLSEELPPNESSDTRVRGDWLEGRLRLESRFRILLPLEPLFPDDGGTRWGE